MKRMKNWPSLRTVSRGTEKNNWRYLQEIVKITLMICRKMAKRVCIQDVSVVSFLFIHSNEVKFYSNLSKFKVWCDATPTQIGIFSERDNRVSLFKRVGNILDNEYIGILVSHLLYPQDIIINDNRAAVCLFTRGKLPPDLRDNFNLNCVLCHIFRDPVVVWVPSAHNLADKYSRFNFVT